MTNRDVNDTSFDVALSFAGEDRQYVERVAHELRAAGLRVFYDRFEATTLWGKDLYTYLDEVYRRRARFTVIFVSRNYASKLWTKHEQRSAQARAFLESREYILPARFDDTELPGILPTTGYIDLRSTPAPEFAALICRKLSEMYPKYVSNTQPLPPASPPKQVVTRTMARVRPLTQLGIALSYALLICICLLRFFLHHQVVTTHLSEGAVYYSLIEPTEYAGPIDPDCLILPWLTLSGMIVGCSLVFTSSSRSFSLGALNGTLFATCGALVAAVVTRLFWNPPGMFDESSWYIRYWLALSVGAIAVDFVPSLSPTRKVLLATLGGMLAGAVTAALTLTPLPIGVFVGATLSALLAAMSVPSTRAQETAEAMRALLIVAPILAAMTILFFNAVLTSFEQVIFVPMAFVLGALSATRLPVEWARGTKRGLLVSIALAGGLGLAVLIAAGETDGTSMMAIGGLSAIAMLLSLLCSAWHSRRPRLRVAGRVLGVITAVAWMFVFRDTLIATAGAVGCATAALSRPRTR